MHEKNLKYDKYRKKFNNYSSKFKIIQNSKENHFRFILVCTTRNVNLSKCNIFKYGGKLIAILVFYRTEKLMKKIYSKRYYIRILAR